jgi:5'-3' exonuclease
MIEDAKKMLTLLGQPIVEAKEEAEAQCCDLVLKGKADAVASEDMDCLTFGSPLLLRSKLEMIFLTFRIQDWKRSYSRSDTQGGA